MITTATGSSENEPDDNDPEKKPPVEMDTKEKERLEKERLEKERLKEEQAEKDAALLPEYSEAYPHLLKRTAGMLHATVDEKIEFIWTDKFIGTENAVSSLALLLDTYAMPAVIRQRGVALVGATAAGKSTLTRQFATLARAHKRSIGRRIPIAETTMPVGANEQRLNLAVCRAMNAPGVESARSTGIATHVVNNHIERNGLRCLIIQEFNNLADAGESAQRMVCDSLKNLMSEHSLMVVLAGTPEFLPILKRKENAQLGNRLIECDVLPLADEDSLREFLTTLEGYYPFPESSCLHEDEVMELVQNHTARRIGKIIALMNEAAQIALLEGIKPKNGVVKPTVRILLRHIRQAALTKYMGDDDAPSTPETN